MKRLSSLEASVELHDDGWEIAACPVNGPAIAAADNSVAVAWFTAPGNAAQVKVAFSADDGASFEAPTRIDEGLPLGRVHIVALDGEDVLVSWLEDTESGTAILMKRVSRNGDRSDAVVVAATDSARASGFPRMAVLDEKVLVAWTDPEPPGRVRTRGVARRGGHDAADERVERAPHVALGRRDAVAHQHLPGPVDETGREPSRLDGNAEDHALGETHGSGR